MGTSINPAPFENTPRMVVLAAVDGSSYAESMAQIAASLAVRMPNAELHVVHVIEHMPTPDDLVKTKPSATELLERGREHLEKIGRAARALFPNRIVVHLAAGAPAREILQMATDLRADLVLVGTHDRRGLDRLVLGSVSARVVREACCPVLVVRPKDYHRVGAADIEPPCAECLVAQRESEGKTLFCARHREHHPHGRLHYELPESFAVGSMLFRP